MITTINFTRFVSLKIVCFIFGFVFAVSSQDVAGGCNKQLFTEDSPNSTAFTASSTAPNSSPSFANEKSSGAGGRGWCPNNLVDNKLKTYLQVDLQKIYRITIIMTKGQDNIMEDKIFFKKYLLQYRRELNGTWFWYTSNNRIISGNKNPSMPQYFTVDPTIIARWIRYYPYVPEKLPSYKGCVRILPHGCPYDSALMEYILQDDLSLPDELHDTVYDGNPTAQKGFRSGGLGKLTDNITEEHLKKKDVYVGFRKHPDGPNYVKIQFRFANLRKFYQARFYAANMFSSEVLKEDVRVFSRVELRFSVAGIYFPESTLVSLDVQRDNRLKLSRWVRVDFEARFGEFVEARFFFDTKAEIMKLGEVAFSSEALLFDMPAEKPPVSTNKETSQPKSASNNQNILIIVFLAILCVIFVVVIIVVAIKFCCKRKKPLHDSSHRPRQTVTNGIVDLNRSDPSQPMMSIHGHMVQDNSVYNTLTGSEPDTMYCGTMNPSPPSARPPIDFRSRGMMPLPNPKSNDCKSNFLDQDYASTTMHPGRYPMGGPNITCNPVLDYMDQQRHPYYSHNAMPHIATLRRGPTTQGGGVYYPHHAPFHPDQPADVARYTSIQGVTGNSTFITYQDLSKSRPNPPLISRSRLTLQEKLGGGKFGEIHRVELRPEVASYSSASLNRTSAYGRKNNNNTVNGSSTMNPSTNGFTNGHLTGTPRLINGNHGDALVSNGSGDVDGSDSSVEGSAPIVAKMLSANAPEPAKYEFDREISLLSRLSDPNVSCLIGVCRDAAGPTYTLMEYTTYGDLHQFLQAHYSGETTANYLPLPPNTRTLSYGALIYMSSQVASGMAYLESMQVVHRDLACRNCLVGSLYDIKISDLGMCRRHYSTDYVEIDGNVKVPIRWMAWESILKGEFTSKSDVWAFGVTLWEILTFCREWPFQRLTDDQVMYNSGLLASNDMSAERLLCPNICPKETFDLIRSCWNQAPVTRPAFQEIKMALRQKTIGYNPRLEPALVAGINFSSSTSTLGGQNGPPGPPLTTSPTST